MKKHLFLKSLLIAIGLLITSINTVWAGNVHTKSGSNIYFDDLNSNWASSYMYFAIGFNGENAATLMRFSPITNTKLYVLSASEWNNADYCCIMGATSDWGSSGGTYSNMETYAAHVSGKITTYTFKAGEYNLITPADGTGGTTISASYKGTSNGCIGKTNQTVNVVVNGSSSPATSPAAISITSYYWSDWDAVTVSTSSNITKGGSTITDTWGNVAYTAKTTVEVTSTTSGYYFVGWYDAATGGNLVSSNTKYVYYPREDNTLYARFETRYPVTVAAGSNGATSPASVTGGYYTASEDATATPNSGYYFTGWTLPGSGVTAASGYNTSSNPIRVNATEASKTITANFAERYILRGSSKDNDANLYGLAGWSATSNSSYASNSISDGVLTITADLTKAKTDYKCLIQDLKDNARKGQTGTGYIPDNDPWTLDGSNDVYFTSTAVGTYTFTYNLSSGSFKVVHPAHYSVTYSYDTGGSSVTATVSGETIGSSPGYAVSGANVVMTATAATGYTFEKWVDGSGNDVSTSNPYTISSISANKTLVAKFTPNTHKITFNLNGGDRYASTGGTYTEGGVQKIDVTYDAALPTPANMPKAQKDGYEFIGWYTLSSAGTVLFSTLTDKTGVWYQNVSNYTSSGNWHRDEDITLYAYYNRGDIGYITYDPLWVMPGSEVTATTHFSSTPEGNFTLCYVLTTNDGQALKVQPDMTKNDADHTVTFNAPVTSGNYRLQARLYKGAGLDCKTDLSTYLLDTYDDTEGEYKFYVEPTNTVTVLYKCGEVEIHPSMTVRATGYSTPASVTAPEIKGLTFTGWTLGVGVSAVAPTTTSDQTIQIRATKDSIMTANYSQSGYVYFKNTYGWDSVYFYRYNDQTYWGGNTKDGYGMGAHKVAGWTHLCLEGPITMEKVDGTDDLYYCKPSSTPGSTESYVFTDKPSTEDFFGKSDEFAPINALVLNCSSWGATSAFNTTNHMIVPNKDQSPNQPGDLYEGHINYYSEYFAIPSLMDWSWTLRGDWGWSTPSEYGHFQAPTMGSTTFQAHRFFEDEDGADHELQVWDSEGANYGNRTTINATTSSPIELTKNIKDGNVTFRSNTPGDYVFNLSFEPSANQKGGFAGKVKLSVEYPIIAGDFRLVYTGGTKPHPGNAIKKRANGEDIVSLFVAAGQSSALKLQPCSSVTADAVVWTALGSCSAPTYADGIDFEDILSKGGAGTYNFTITQDKNGANPTVTKVEKYVGPFYIRTDCVNSDKWKFWESKDDHEMTYTDYSTTLTTDPYSHYFMKWIAGTSKVKFCVANDYSYAISDTLDTDDLLTSGPDVSVTATNVRFMYNEATNTLKRAYTYGPASNLYMILRTPYVSDGTKAWLYRSWTNSSTYTRIGKTEAALDGVVCDTLQFKDNGNWVYQADVYARPGAPIKLTGYYGGNTQYFKGTTGESYSTSGGTPDAVQLIGGTTGDPQHIRITYDFKTNRMVTAWMPSGSALTEDLDLKADVMIIRQHQEAGAAITFDGDHQISNVKTIYGVIQLNKSTLNDVTLSQYERDLFWISFPFDVKLSDVFGFGEYMRHWGIQYYDGKGRAKNGYWIDSNSNWKFFTAGMRDTTVLKANEGYVLAVDLDLLGPTASVWDNDVTSIYLYFPSTTTLGTIKNIADTLVHIDTVGYQCTIDRRYDKTKPNPSLDRRVRDSHWHLIGAPSFAGANRTYSTSWGEGIYSDVPNVSDADWSTVNLPFIYDWDATTNTLSPVKTGTYTFKPMHSYLVQYGKDTIRWKSIVNVPPVVAAVKAHQTKQQDFDLTLHILRGANLNDQTFIRLTEDEEVTDDFEFNYDLSKETNHSRANVWTVTADGTPAAGNSMPFSTETKIVAIGINTPATDNYTFAMLEGTNGVGVVLVDNVANTRTNLSLTDYTVNLEAGQYDGRFSLEISPIVQNPTDVVGVNDQNSTVRKVMVDGILYIVKDGIVYDACGNRIQ